jgi:hypothetical protein
MSHERLSVALSFLEIQNIKLFGLVNVHPYVEETSFIAWRES